MTTRGVMAKRRQEARDLMSKAGRSSTVERRLSDQWGVGRRQTRKIMTAALKEMAIDRPRSEENLAALEAVAWEGLTRAVTENNHKAINAYLRSLAHIEANSQPAGSTGNASPADRAKLLKKAARQVRLLEKEKTG